LSGFYGIYRYDGAPVDANWLERMKAAMAYYGPHGQGCQIAGPVALGHLSLHVNPEDVFERQPMRGQRGLVVSAARLDNRDELLEALSVPALQASQTTDGHLVSLAFDRWGEELCPHLQGDWALAAWDPRSRRLLLVRDAYGSGTLYYHEAKGYIAFASSLKALLALPGVVKEPDRMRLAQILVGWQCDAQLTAYKGFRRLLGAYAMTVAPDGRAHTWRHWSPEGRAFLNYRRDEDYEEAFVESYTRAVRSCLRTQKPVAMELSGGRDSGSVAAVAAPLLASQGRGLTAYTSVPFFPPDGAYEGRFGNEWDQAHTTAKMAGSNVRHFPIDAANYGVIQGIEHVLDIHDGPNHGAINNYWIQAIMDAASRDGNGVLLNGHLGNATVSWTGNGSALLALLQGHPATAGRLFLYGEPNPWRTLKRQVLKPLLQPGLNALRLNALRRSIPSRGRPWQEYSALNPRAADELDLDGRMRAEGWDPTFRTSPLEDIRLRFFLPKFGLAPGLSLRDEVAAMYSLPSLDPTVNLSLIEFLLRVPDDQFRRRGQSSSLMSRAFRKRMPEPVLLGKRRGLQAADAGHRILQDLPAFRDCLSDLDSLPEAREMLDMPLLHRCLEDLVASVDPHTTLRAGCILLRGLAVGIFLRRLARSRSADLPALHACPSC
jgi:asparagine synthase (glutamine-hydrolysing)